MSDDPEGWNDTPAETPEQAVEQYLEARDDRASDMAYDIVSGNPQDFEVFGYYETDTPLHEDDQFDGYEMGQKYFTHGGDIVVVRVSLLFEKKAVADHG
ncbi:MAG: hypothetical protein H0W48_00665 [Methylibium sp.]|nr:hypothetical protein [Methylibium sp.]